MGKTIERISFYLLIWMAFGGVRRFSRLMTVGDYLTQGYGVGYPTRLFGYMIMIVANAPNVVAILYKVVGYPGAPPRYKALLLSLIIYVSMMFLDVFSRLLWLMAYPPKAKVPLVAAIYS
jgi:hypothetical protein